MWTNSYDLEQLGAFLQEARKEKGLLQTEFAAKLGVSHTTLSNLEQGKNTSTETLQLALSLLGYRMVIAPKTADVRVIEYVEEEPDA